MSYNNKRSFSGQKNSGRSAAPTRRRFSSAPKRGNRKQYINPDMFVNKNTREKNAAPTHEIKHTFKDFAFNRTLEANLEKTGFSAPSPIQDKTIPFAMEGRDVIGLANTGTGKTAAFLLPILHKLASTRAISSVLIMAPTRELAQQIDAEFRKFSDGMKLYSAVCVGGVNISGQIRQLKRGPHIIIGTPGRLKDLMNRGMIRTDDMDTLVLDEADRMLDMGFVHDIRMIASQLPTEGRQTLCFSATMSDGVKMITRDFMQNPELISVKVNETNDHIYQDVVHYNDDEHKKDTLVTMLKQSEFEKVIIFGETKFGVQRLSDKLAKEGIAADAIHGNKSQGQRNRSLTAFKSNQTNVLVATDVAARGLDIPNVSHVINFDTPQSYDDYVHRIGRTGRAGKSGTALTFIRKR
jgi:ATP-dependent RNA helicase RhlE